MLLEALSLSHRKHRGGRRPGGAGTGCPVPWTHSAFRSEIHRLVQDLHMPATPLLSLSGSVVVLGRECQTQRGAVTIPGSAMSKRTQVTKFGLGSRPSGSEGSVPAHVALPLSGRHLLGASSLLNVQSPSSLPHRGSAHLWVFRTSVPPPPGPASSRLPSSVSPSTLWPPLPRLPGIPLIGSCRPGLPPPPAPGLC